MGTEKRDWRDITRLYPYDITRSNEHQGRFNRWRVALQAIEGATIAVLAIGAIVLCVLNGAPIWATAASLGFLLFGALVARFWLRAYRHSAPQRPEQSAESDSHGIL